MKTTLLRIAFILCIPLLMFTFLATKKLKADDPSRTPHSGLIIKKDLQDEKWQAIKNILSAPSSNEDASPRGELYRIRVYDGHGKYKEMGCLPEKMLVEDFSDVPCDYKGHAIQVGVGAVDDVDHYPTPSPSPTGTPFISLHFKSRLEESGKMKQAVDKVVQENNTSPSPVPSSTPRLSLHYRANIEESKKMVEEINKVLSSPSPSPSKP